MIIIMISYDCQEHKVLHMNYEDIQLKIFYQYAYMSCEKPNVLLLVNNRINIL